MKTSIVFAGTYNMDGKRQEPTYYNPEEAYAYGTLNCTKMEFLAAYSAAILSGAISKPVEILGHTYLKKSDIEKVVAGIK